MLGDSSSVLATTTTTSGTSGGGGGGGGGNAKSNSNSEVVRQLLTGAHEGSSSTEVGHGHHVIGSTGEENRETGRGGGGDIDGDRSFGGNRWPRQETLSLLKIRSDMDVAFRDASVKGPLWEEVSRKLAEIGYNRSAKKCKEKFENVYKYHKRTKEGRSGKQEGKTYRFFDQLAAFENHPSALPSPTPPPPKPQPLVATPKSMPAAAPNPPRQPHRVVASQNTSTVPSTTATLASTTMTQGIVTSSVNFTIPSFPAANPTILPPTNPTNSSQANIHSSFPNFSPDLISNSTSSSTSSDLELQGQPRRKRKWKDFFETLMNVVIQKQEEMQKKFLEAIEKREHERMDREESWRMQEMARINREREILAQERSISGAKDAAVMAFLQKLSEQQNPPGQVLNNPLSPAVPPPPQSQPLVQPQQPPPAQLPAAPPPQQLPVPALQPMPVSQVPLPLPAANMEIVKLDNNGDQSFTPTYSSRWPKVEVQALISLRTNLDSKYQETGPKGPLWEQISAGMRKLGYNRNAKRCKEKWENINKYFKKVKESSKKRPEDSKTCPYFHQLDALCREKNKMDCSSITHHQLKPENSIPLMVQPEQQWPPPQQGHGQDSVMEDLESEDNQNHHQDEVEKDNEEGEEDEASGYEVVASKPASMSTDE